MLIDIILASTSPGFKMNFLWGWRVRNDKRVDSLSCQRVLTRLCCVGWKNCGRNYAATAAAAAACFNGDEEREKKWYRSVIQGCRLLYGIQKNSFTAIRRLLPLLVAFFMEDASLWKPNGTRNMEIWSVNILRRIG